MRSEQRCEAVVGKTCDQKLNWPRARGNERVHLFFRNLSVTAIDSRARRDVVSSPPLFFDHLILHEDGIHDGAWNMAIDQAWLETSDHAVLRIYGWDQPTVTLGYAQNLARMKEHLPDWPIVRRWTGGGVVMHDQDHTYSLMIPAVVPWAQTPAVQSYEQIHRALARHLVDAGYEGCRLAQAEDVIEGPLCFTAPALHDVVSGSLKIAGAGQRRGRLGILHQGSVQNVQMQPSFWQTWAAQIAQRVSPVSIAPKSLQNRAAELVEKRFALPQWLTDRDDLLG